MHYMHGGNHHTTWCCTLQPHGTLHVFTVTDVMASWRAIMPFTCKHTHCPSDCLEFANKESLDTHHRWHFRERHWCFDRNLSCDLCDKKRKDDICATLPNKRKEPDTPRLKASRKQIKRLKKSLNAKGDLVGALRDKVSTLEARVKELERLLAEAEDAKTASQFECAALKIELKVPHRGVTGEADQKRKFSGVCKRTQQRRIAEIRALLEGVAVTYGIDNGAHGVCCAYIMYILAAASASNARRGKNGRSFSIARTRGEPRPPRRCREARGVEYKKGTLLCDQ